VQGMRMFADSVRSGGRTKPHKPRFGRPRNLISDTTIMIGMID
jgi:hypothetical protein